METKYHINPNTGRAVICRATVRECPLKDTVHGNTKAEAKEAWEKRNESDTLSVPLQKTPAIEHVSAGRQATVQEAQAVDKDLGDRWVAF